MQTFIRYKTDYLLRNVWLKENQTTASELHYRDQTRFSTFAGHRERCWKSEPERREFQLLLRGPANVSAQENHVWSLLLYKNTVWCTTTRNLWRKCTRKSVLSLAKNLQEWHVHCVCFENIASSANTSHVDILVLRLLLWMTSVFVTALECLQLKQQIRFVTARESPC